MADRDDGAADEADVDFANGALRVGFAGAGELRPRDPSAESSSPSPLSDCEFRRRVNNTIQTEYDENLPLRTMESTASVRSASSRPMLAPDSSQPD